MDEQIQEKPIYSGRDLEAMSFAKNYYGWLLEEIRPFIGDFVAEVGAGRGNFSRYLLKTEAKHLCAYEPSENMFHALQKQFQNDSRIQAVNANFSGPGEKKKEPFDTVVYINVLEHIADDAGELTAVFDSLIANGHLIVFVPALSFLYSACDRQLGHYRRYHKSDLIGKTTAAGFKIVKAIYLDFLGIIPWYVAFTLLRNSLSGAKVSLYDRVCIPVVKLIEQTVRPPFGKNLLLVAKKVNRCDASNA